MRKLINKIKSFGTYESPDITGSIEDGAPEWLIDGRASIVATITGIVVTLALFFVSLAYFTVAG